MLEVSGTMRRDVPKGANVAELKQVGTQKVPTMGGYKTEPKWAAVYTEGQPFGDLKPVAPVALKADDVLVVSADTGQALRVERDSEIVWQAEAEADG